MSPDTRDILVEATAACKEPLADIGLPHEEKGMTRRIGSLIAMMLLPTAVGAWNPYPHHGSPPPEEMIDRPAQVSPFRT